MARHMADDDKDKLDKLIEVACDDGWNSVADGWGPSEFDDLEVGPPLSADELKTARADLARWRSLLDFRRTVHTLHKRCRSKELFNNPHMNFLLDSWTLAELVRHKPVDEVRLADPSEQWPDGYIKMGDKIEKVEATMVIMPGRRLGAEYRFSGKPELDPVDNWVERAKAIPGALENAINAKARKRYGSKMLLVIYLNMNEYGIRQAETERAIAEIKQCYAQTFDQVFVIWKEKVL